MSLDIKLSNDIKLIIECCKENKNNTLMEEYLKDIKNWEDFISLSSAHGVFPLVYHTLKQFQNLIPENIFQKIKSTNMNIVKQNMLMTSELIKVMKLLEENGIEAIAFKGPVLSQMAYGDISLRQYVDLDILVDEKDLNSSLNLLEKIEYKSDKNTREKKLQNRSIFHDIALLGKVTIELHWRLFSDEFNTGLEDIDVKNSLYEISVFNKNFKTFKNEILFLYLCIHGAKHNWERIEWLVDIDKLVRKNDIDFKVLLDLSKKTKTEKILYSTLYLCNSILNLKLPNIVEKKLDKSKLDLSKRFEKLFYKRFKDNLSKKVETKNISKIQYDLLDGYKARFLFLSSLIKPTELEYETIKLPKYLSITYYFIRPFNIIKRWLKKL